ncbi:MAG: hypothetical protein AAB217_22890 [Chloroflexota bacterium]
MPKLTLRLSPECQRVQHPAKQIELVLSTLGFVLIVHFTSPIRRI